MIKLTDKALHFWISMAITILLSFLFINQLKIANGIVYAMIYVMLIGFEKELIDAVIRKRVFSWKDIVADLAGTIIGAIAYTVIASILIYLQVLQIRSVA